MNAHLDFFIRESVSHARSLPLESAMNYLGGMLLLSNESPQLGAVRSALNTLRNSDHQLELIASGQLKLPLSEPSTKKAPRK